MASLFSLSTQLLFPLPKRVIAAGRQPIGGSDITPILLAPSSYRFCYKRQCDSCGLTKKAVVLRKLRPAKGRGEPYGSFLGCGSIVDCAVALTNGTDVAS